MADPEFEWGLMFNADGSLNILRSPFFDTGFDHEDTVGEYLERILPSLVRVIDRQFQDYVWTIIGRHPPPLPPAATSPVTKSFVSFSVVALSIFVWFFLLH
ncbi:hypothetical protein MA16_Dca026740 [Dendrobium catenatum]|uniref:Uncharacterized protein n=1 Tax=Dendrobium catenatum TaxID=906689 RepID=A0A2I0V7C6_9ASPA|nr:hypothetical protein MA16_Dca026740 [Dendrobium catenatum]